MAYDSTTIKGLSVTTPTESTSYVPELNDSDREIKTVLKNQYACAAKTANYTLLASDNFITGSGTFTITLPTPSDVASATFTKKYTILNIGTGIITITNAASENINGAATDIVLTGQWSGFDIWTNGTDWYAQRFNNNYLGIEGAAIASAATTDIWAAYDGETKHITGTTTITSFGTAPQAGAWMKVIFDGILTLTHGANLNLQGSLNIITAANDWAFVYADTTTLFRVVYFRASGAAVQSGISFSVDKGGVDQTAIPTASPTKVTWPTEQWDVGSTFASDKWTPGKIGRYHSTVHLYSTTFGASQMLIYIYKNGVAYKEDVIYSNASIQTLPFDVDLDVDTITDYFEVFITHNLGSNGTLSGLATRTWWQGHEVR